MGVKKKILTGKKIVLCHGVFDLVHIGHVKHFRVAKSLGDILIVSITKSTEGIGIISYNGGLAFRSINNVLYYMFCFLGGPAGRTEPFKWN